MMPTATEPTALWVFWAIAITRFLLPLTIPKYPLPGILASLILDAVDQTIFQQFPSLNLEGYQGYDKALDIYYLTIAYISTLRNWENHFAFRISRFLFYWRLIGVALFELTHLRPLLLIFPNTFEYFFIFYEAYRLRWEPKRMSKKLAIGAAVAIWIVIKLPQEYWIHIAQTDTTDWIKTSLFKVPVDTPWSLIFQTWTWVFLCGFAVLAIVLVAVGWLIKKRTPPADYRLGFSSDAHRERFTSAQVRRAFAIEDKEVLDAALLEKVVLIALVSLTFAQVIPGVYSSDLQLVLGISLVVVINGFVSQWLARRRFGWVFTVQQIAVVAALNLALILGYALVRSMFENPLRIVNVLFFSLLLTLLVGLYDRYRLIYLMRFGMHVAE